MGKYQDLTKRIELVIDTARDVTRVKNVVELSVARVQLAKVIDHLDAWESDWILINYSNELANNYPVTQQEAYEYVKMNIDNAEMACKVRSYGFPHNDAVWLLRVGVASVRMFSGQRYKNLADLCEKISAEN